MELINSGSFLVTIKIWNSEIMEKWHTFSTYAIKFHAYFIIRFFLRCVKKDTTQCRGIKASLWSLLVGVVWHIFGIIRQSELSCSCSTFFYSWYNFSHWTFGARLTQIKSIGYITKMCFKCVNYFIFLSSKCYGSYCMVWFRDLPLQTPHIIGHAERTKEIVSQSLAILIFVAQNLLSSLHPMV